MDVYSIGLCLPLHGIPTGATIYEDIAKQYGPLHPHCQFTVNSLGSGVSMPREGNTDPTFALTITGPISSVMEARPQILRAFTNNTRREVTVLQPKAPSPSAIRAIKSANENHTSPLASSIPLWCSHSQDSQITAVDHSPEDEDQVTSSKWDYLYPGATLSENKKARLNEGWKEWNVCLAGPMEKVEAEFRDLFVERDIQLGHQIGKHKVDYKLQNMVAGRARSALRRIEEQLGVRIYLAPQLMGIYRDARDGQSATPDRPPLPAAAANVLSVHAKAFIPQATSPQGSHPGLGQHYGEHGDLDCANLIIITGKEEDSIEQASRILQQSAEQIRHRVVSLEVCLLPVKRDWILRRQLDMVRKIMADNATYAQLPLVGSGHQSFVVFGENKTNIHRTVRQLMALACEIIGARIYLPRGEPSITQKVVGNISLATGVEVAYSRDSKTFQVYGSLQQIREACKMVLELSLKALIYFEVEASVDDHSFITGLKQGKLNSIMKSAPVKIQTRHIPGNEFNFAIDVLQDGASGDVDAIKGLDLLVEELPAEISFNIDPQHHQAVIGDKGKLIQGIQIQFQVRIHCANEREHLQRGGYLENKDNVLIQCPAKNKARLALAKAAVLALVPSGLPHHSTESPSGLEEVKDEANAGSDNPPCISEGDRSLQVTDIMKRIRTRSSRHVESRIGRPFYEGPADQNDRSAPQTSGLDEFIQEAQDCVGVPRPRRATWTANESTGISAQL